MMQCRTAELSSIAAQKEQEWRDVMLLRSQALETDLKNVQKELDDEKAKFHKLKEDFKFNLKLLSERDAELDKYDSVFRELKSQVVAKDREMSDIKIHMADLETELMKERKDKEDVHKHFQKRIREKQAEIERYTCEKDAEIVEERKDIEIFKRKLERRVLELEEELDIQRRDLNTGFESAMKKREHEFRLQQEELSGQLLAQEMKVKLQEQEIDILKKDKANHEQELNNAEGNCRRAEKQLKQCQWQKDDELAIAHAQLSDMQLKVQNAEAALKRGKEDFERKHAELDSRAKEKELTLHKVKEGSVEREALLQEEINGLKEQLAESGAQYRQLQWNKDELQKQFETQIEQLTDENSELNARLQRHEKEVYTAKTTAESEVILLQDQVSQFKIQIDDRKKDIERYKTELRHAADREAKLERSKAQQALDWQRKCEEVENKQFEKSEDLVKSLTKARDTALANVKEMQREIEHKDQLIQVFSVERDQAFATLKQHGITIDRHVAYDIDDLPPSVADKVQSVQHQNDTLKQVIHNMRTEMEKVGSSSVSEEYVKQLEKEVKELKSKQNSERNLKKLEVMAENIETKEVETDNVGVRSHIDALNTTIGQLRGEKIELSATVRKQQAQLLHLQTQVEQMAKTPKEQESALMELQYKTGALERRYQAEILGLKQQISHLESQLKEARSEADSYHKAVTEANCENASLRQQLSASKIEVAEGRPSVNFGAQELLIQQYQDEIQHLRKQLMGKVESLETGKPIKGTNAELQSKLRQAVSHIKQLAKEKQQLIEVGNRLRAQLNQQHHENLTPPELRTVEPSQLQTKVDSKLKELERLQYQLTKQELTVQKRDAPKTAVHPEVMRSEDLEDDQPKSILKKSSSSTVASDVPIQTSPSTNPYNIASGSVESFKSADLLGSISSVGGGSLQEVWNMLQDAESLGSPTPRRSPHRSNPFSEFEIKGKAPAMTERPKQPPKSPPTRQRSAKGSKQGRGSKFIARNWNEKT